MQFRRRQRQNLLIDITPLIDVVFLLLIFFMVTTTFTWQSELMINLPEAEGQPQEAQANAIRVTVDKEGNYFINDKALVNNQRATLTKALQEASVNGSATPLVITGDAQAPHQAVVTVMDVAGQLGFSRIDITTKKPDELH
jgi:biopolymer transport protein ExbD